ncbi:ABC transporter permease [Paraconexibacter sp.]|uniref:ABC transporter permease n=1 Tax=Paraconexibacter sp. TaxID=2949640 RepID=UPI00356389E2
MSSDVLARDEQFLDEFDALAPHADETFRQKAKRILNLTWTLAITDFRLRFYGSVLGVLWTLIRPFAFFGVIYIVFTEIAGLDADVPYYGVYILFAIVLFTFFAEVTTTSVQSLVLRENLLRKMHFEPIVIPLSVMVTGLLNLSTTLVAVMLFALGNGIYPTWTWLQLPLIVVLIAMFANGLGMLLSTLYVKYRDIYPIWEVTSQIMFYASSTLYVATTVPIDWREEFLTNPLSACFAQMRHAVIDPSAPSAGEIMRSDVRLLIPLGIIFGTFALGAWAFRRASPRIAENL